MAIILALCSAICSSFSSIITKKGVRDADPDLAALIRAGFTFLITGAVFLFSRSWQHFSVFSLEGLLLLLSGICSGFSWLFYFKALSLGNLSQLAPVDNFSTILTMLLAVLFLHESITAAKILAALFIFIGTLLMSGGFQRGQDIRQTWLLYALLAMTTASCSSILTKLALIKIDPSFAAALRNFISLFIAAVFAARQRKVKESKRISPKSLGCLIISGVLIGISALCSCQAMQLGELSVIAPIDKSSLPLTVFLSCIFLKERLSRQNWAGLLFIILGTLPLVISF